MNALVIAFERWLGIPFQQETKFTFILPYRKGRYYEKTDEIYCTSYVDPVILLLHDASYQKEYEKIIGKI